MAEYIDRDALRKHLLECYTDEFFDADMKKAVVGIDVYVENMPAADVQPVVHGYWKEVDDGWDTYWKCSVCGDSWKLEEGTPEENHMKYCQNCGARMDGDAECQ